MPAPVYFHVLWKTLSLCCRRAAGWPWIHLQHLPSSPFLFFSSSSASSFSLPEGTLGCPGFEAPASSAGFEAVAFSTSCSGSCSFSSDSLDSEEASSVSSSNFSSSASRFFFSSFSSCPRTQISTVVEDLVFLLDRLSWELLLLGMADNVACPDPNQKRFLGFRIQKGLSWGLGFLGYRVPLGGARSLKRDRKNLKPFFVLYICTYVFWCMPWHAPRGNRGLVFSPKAKQTVVCLLCLPADANKPWSACILPASTFREKQPVHAS